MKEEGAAQGGFHRGNGSSMCVSDEWSNTGSPEWLPSILELKHRTASSNFSREGKTDAW
jgi:hypothetical protein